jgi:hypothetical protein
MQIRPWLAADQLSPATTPTQGLQIRPVRSNRRAPVPVYRTGLTGNRSKPVGFKFEFKSPSATSFDWFTDRFDQFTGRYDRFTGRFDRFTKWALMGRPIFFFFCLTSNARKVC